MEKIVLITGATDGIGLATAHRLAGRNCRLLLHGRNPEKLERAKQEVSTIIGDKVETYKADLSRMSEVVSLANDVSSNHSKLDVLINNAGVWNATQETTGDGLDVRFAVNTIAPYLLTQKLLPMMNHSGRVVNLSSAAQAPVDLRALSGSARLSAGAAYAQSKLALTMWSREMAQTIGDNGPVIVSVNPGSMLGSKMVKQAFGVSGGDVGIGADILTRAALDEAFVGASGMYFDNDSGRFASPHPDGLDGRKSREVIAAIKSVLSRVLAEG